ncbi:hypothetical protein B4U80_00058 [Leptotrombidium deliense]|uniref:RanBP2-type domain-containing protein n=1 Tax=Leptotrombidium deliense TaxID=299467 RepID=A0A443SHC9_9ACAR|nr:hypothetical protein B4U80_00058 [Leptotrombidium deliense]
MLTKGSDDESVAKNSGSEMKDEENTWECSVCTFRNSGEAFKCLMCDVRKGTSTRKPRINPQLVAQQVARQQQQIQQQALKASAKMAEKEAKQMEKVKSPSSISGERKKSRESANLSDASASPTNEVIGPALSPGPSTKVSKKKTSKEEEPSESSSSSTVTKSYNNLPKTRLKGVDRKNTSTKAVTVNNVTIIVTEFQPKKILNHDTHHEKISKESTSESNEHSTTSVKSKKKSSGK